MLEIMRGKLGQRMSPLSRHYTRKILREFLSKLWLRSNDDMEYEYLLALGSHTVLFSNDNVAAIGGGNGHSYISN